MEQKTISILREDKLNKPTAICTYLERRWAAPSNSSPLKCYDGHTENYMPDQFYPESTINMLSAVLPQGAGDKCDIEMTIHLKGGLPSKRTSPLGQRMLAPSVCSRFKELTHQFARYKWDILGLTEVIWTGIGEIITDEGHTLWYSGEDSKQQHSGIHSKQGKGELSH